MDDVEVKKSNNTNLKVRRIVYYILGVLEVLFAFRLVLKLLGANDESTFVSIIYAITSVLLAPFLAIFRTATTSGIETKAVLEPSTIIGMIVYALVAWGIVKIIEINKVPKN
ncbi:MAG: YggT family protein [Clostridia bacterium]